MAKFVEAILVLVPRDLAQDGSDLGMQRAVNALKLLATLLSFKLDGLANFEICVGREVEDLAILAVSETGIKLA